MEPNDPAPGPEAPQHNVAHENHLALMLSVQCDAVPSCWSNTSSAPCRNISWLRCGRGACDVTKIEVRAPDNQEYLRQLVIVVPHTQGQRPHTADGA